MITADELYEKHTMSEGEAQRYFNYASKYIPTNRMMDLVLTFVGELCDNGFTERHVMTILHSIVQGNTEYWNGKDY